MGMVLVVILLLFMADTRPHHYRSVPVDMAKVARPVSMRDADREDAMIVSVTRDGRVYFGGEQVPPDALPLKIADRLKDHNVERKVHIKADTRARWGAVKQVLDGVRAVGLLRVAFLVEQRRAAAVHM